MEHKQYNLPDSMPPTPINSPGIFDSPNILALQKAFSVGVGDDTTSIDPRLGISLKNMRTNLSSQYKIYNSRTSSIASIQDFTLLDVADKTHKWPNKSGTVAMTDDITSGAELTLYAVPGEGFIEGASFRVNPAGDYPTVGFDDAASNEIWHMSFRVPSSANGLLISQVRVRYEIVGTTDRNLYLTFDFDYFAPTNNDAATSDSDGPRAYATGTATSTNMCFIDVNSAAYDGIGAVATDGLLMMSVNRQGADALDTYGQIWYVTRVDITFA